MTYATIGSVSIGDLADEVFYNQILANLTALYNPVGDGVTIDRSPDYSVTAQSSWADVDAVNLTFTLNLDEQSDVLVGFNAVMSTAVGTNSGPNVYLTVSVDGINVVDDDGIIGFTNDSSVTGMPISFTYLIEDLSAGSHTFRLRWKTAGQTGSNVSATMFAGAGTTRKDTHPHFWGKKF